jgi:hypothetical protein
MGRSLSQDYGILSIAQSGSRTCQISYLLGPGCSSSGVKRPGREVGHSPPTRGEKKKMGMCNQSHTSICGSD